MKSRCCHSIVKEFNPPRQYVVSRRQCKLAAKVGSNYCRFHIPWSERKVKP